MKSILILQYRTDDSEYHEQHCIAKKLGLSIDNLDVRNVIRNQEIPTPQQLSNYLGVISGASGQFNVTDLSTEVKQSIEKTYPLMDEIITQDIPFLALCFGHQLLAKFLGGRVERDSNQAESDSSRIILTYQGQKSPLYTSLIPSFYAASGHKESVVELPPDAELLAMSERCNIQSYRIKNNIFTTQFHPELDINDVRFRLTLRPEYCFGRSIDEIVKDYSDISQSGIVLKNFKNIMQRKEKK